MIKAVIDTNVLVSAFWTKNRLSPTVRIANAIAQDMFTPVYSTEMISEYREVLSRTKFGNIKHYPYADFVVTPAQFCELLGI